MDAQELPFGLLRDRISATQHQSQPESSNISSNQPLDSVMSEPYHFDSYSHPTNVEEPIPRPSNQRTSMNANTAPWPSMNMNPIPFYGGFRSHFPPAEQHRYPGALYTSPVHSLTIPTTDMVSRERESIAIAANRRAVQEARLAASLTAQQDPPAKLSTPPCKSTGTASRKPVEGECPVCWEPFLDTQTILFCQTTCGNNFHKSCIVEWLTAPANRQELLKCPMCRGAWDDQELKELHQENGISSPRPTKRFRADPAWALRQQRQEHMRRITRQRVYERRNSAERSRTYDNRPDFFVRDEQSPQLSPTTSPTSPQNQFSPTMAYQLPINPSFTPMPRPAPGMVQPMVPGSSNNSQPPAFGVSQFMPNVNNNNNGFRPAQMMPFQFQPPQAISAFRAQPGPPYPMHPAMTPQNYQPANMSMSQFGQMSQNHPQGTRTPATPVMQHNTLPAQQHPCPAMRQQNMTTQQQIYPGNFAPQQPSPGSQASWEYHQYYYSQTYTTVYMNH